MFLNCSGMINRSFLPTNLFLQQLVNHKLAYLFSCSDLAGLLGSAKVTPNVVSSVLHFLMI